MFGSFSLLAHRRWLTRALILPLLPAAENA
jgi:hypothetical protein